MPFIVRLTHLAFDQARELADLIDAGSYRFPGLDHLVVEAILFLVVLEGGVPGLTGCPVRAE
ncbi:hypothetical protein [Mycolicibacterium mucogenicum]|uniref:hypothetical protein n=1 Tax=Mycolicibacterium mucogenicum TaxID=56689 RepID=UPI000769D6BE|nr:hypothetical protein [Mycolicibacterium mucogenicum]